MRKRIIGPNRRHPGFFAKSRRWKFPRKILISPSSSFSHPRASRGWRAVEPGQQTVRLIFDKPLVVRRLRFHFIDAGHERTQEFTVRWFSANGGEPKEIVRQQWNFSPGGSTREVEDYEANLENVSALELVIKPDLRRDDARATGRMANRIVEAILVNGEALVVCKRRIIQHFTTFTIFTI